MVSPELIFLKFLNKVNKGNTQGDTAIDKDRFVLIFNEVKNRWVEQHLKEKDSILIDSLWEIVKTTELKVPKVNIDDYSEYEIPGDFYELILASCIAKRGSCRRKIFLREVKNQDKNNLRFNSNYRPDFDYEWSFVSLQDSHIRVYKKDFDVEGLSIEYYKVIPDLDIEGYIHLDGSLSTNVPIPLSEQYVDQIINLAAEEFERNFQNPQDLQIAKDRTRSQE